jgi:hypothetical protein
VTTLDFTIARPWRVKKYRFTGGLKVYNVFKPREAVTSRPTSRRPSTAGSSNPLHRSIGFAFSTGSP